MVYALGTTTGVIVCLRVMPPLIKNISVGSVDIVFIVQLFYVMVAVMMEFENSILVHRQELSTL